MKNKVKQYAKQVAAARAAWANVAKLAGWYNNRVAVAGGFYVHVWVDKDGAIIDSIYQHPSVKKDTVEVGRRGIV